MAQKQTDELERAAAPNPFRTDPEDDLPVGAQLDWRLRSLIRTGRLGRSERLPSVRRLAEWAGVNVNTVRAVYAKLERDGLVATRHGQGTFVADDVEVAPRLEEIANDALRAAGAAGLDPRELAVVLGASAAIPAAPPPAEPALHEPSLPDVGVESEAIEVRQELRRQIARLEAALAPYVRDLPPEEPGARRTAPPRVVGVEQLEETRDALIARLSTAQAAAEERARSEARARARREAMLREPEAHRWEVVSSEEAGEEGCLEYRVEPRLGPLGAAMSWWRVKVSGGCPLAVPREAAIGLRGPALRRRSAVGALLPLGALIGQVGSMMILTARSVLAAVAPPYPYGEEFVWQFLFALRLCWFPLLVSTLAFSFGAPGLQAANFLSLFGALDRLGGFFVLAAIRQIAPVVTAIVVAGVAGTAITADLGARKIREELDALQVLGVDPVKNLVVPRFLALMLVTALLDLGAMVVGLAAGVLAELLYHQPLGGFFATLFSNASVTDLWGSVVMCTAFGAIIAIVCSYKGMTASGGAAGVGRAVNQAVVIAFLGVSAFNYVFTAFLLATHPALQAIR